MIIYSVIASAYILYISHAFYLIWKIIFRAFLELLGVKNEEILNSKYNIYVSTC